MRNEDLKTGTTWDLLMVKSFILVLLVFARGVFILFGGCVHKNLKPASITSRTRRFLAAEPTTIYLCLLPGTHSPSLLSPGRVC